MLKERKMSVKRGISLGASIGYLFGIMILFLFDLSNAFITCSTAIIIGIILGLLINFLYNLNYNKNL